MCSTYVPDRLASDSCVLGEVVKRSSVVRLLSRDVVLCGCISISESEGEIFVPVKLAFAFDFLLGSSSSGYSIVANLVE